MACRERQPPGVAHAGRVLPWRDGMWDANQRAGFPALVDMEWGGSYALQRYKGRARMSYFGGTGRGYEAIEAPLSIGVAWTKDDPATAHAWESGRKAGPDPRREGRAVVGTPDTLQDDGLLGQGRDARRAPS